MAIIGYTTVLMYYKNDNDNNKNGKVMINKWFLRGFPLFLRGDPLCLEKTGKGYKVRPPSDVNVGL